MCRFPARGAAGAAAFAAGHLCLDAVLRIVLEVQVGVWRQIVVAGRERIGQARGCSFEGVGSELVLDCSSVAVALTGLVIAKVFGVGDVTGAVLDDQSLNVAQIAVGVTRAVIRRCRRLDSRPARVAGVLS